MNLTEEQRQRATAWILQGAKLAEIQNRLLSEFGIKLTYMEVRLLVDDLKVTPKDPEPVAASNIIEEKKSAPAAGKVSAGVDPVTGGGPPGAEPAGSKVSVSVDQIARPGAVVSGKVAFSDGQKADWYLDQTGRLGVMPGQPGYKPSAADVQEFQIALQEELQRIGF